MLWRLLVIATAIAAFQMDASAIPLAAEASSAMSRQPTFGRPKRDKTKSVGSESSPTEPPPPVQPRRPEAIPEWRDDDPPRLAPGPEVEPGKVYAWKTAEGTRYAWSLPFDYKAGQAYNLVVLLHPAGSDFRWGLSAHARTREGFRPGDMLIAIEGTAPDPRRGGSAGTRFFEISPAAMVRFRDSMLEFTRSFPIKRMYLYGQGGVDERATATLSDQTQPQPRTPPRLLSGGGAFAAAFAASFPALADGVLAHGAGAPESARLHTTVPMVLSHGQKDPATPLAATLDAAAGFAENGHKGVRVRVLRGFNDFPNPVRASEAIDYLDGVRTDDPAEALADAEHLLTPKPADEFDYSCPVWFAGAYEVLARLSASEADPDRPLEIPTPVQQARARALMDAIDAEARANAEAIRPLLGAAGLRAIPLDGGAWLGYLVAFRSDFRGVPACERFASELGVDALAAAHAAAAHVFLEAWTEHSNAAEAADRYRDAITALPTCFLYEGLPPDLTPFMRACTRKGDDLHLSSDERDRFELATLWDRGWRDGLNAYAARWRAWTPPPIPEASPPDHQDK